jgi:hypothetical protein
MFTSSPLEPEALPNPPWFMDRLSEDLPPNPPNSLVHFPQEILPPPMVHNPQCMNIWFMSSMPLHHLCDTPSTSSPPEDNHTVIVTNVTSLGSPIFSYMFHCDEDILEELTTPMISHGMRSITECSFSHRKPFTLLF